MKADERQKRDLELTLRRKAYRLTYPQLGEEFGLNEKQCRRIVKAVEEKYPTLLSQARLGAIFGQVEQIDRDIDDLDLQLAVRPPHKTRGLLAAKLVCLNAKAELLMRLGLLPTDTFLRSEEQRLEQLAVTLAQIAHDRGLSDEVPERLMQILAPWYLGDPVPGVIPPLRP